MLREFGPPLTEFRAGIIVGNGSMSFEIIRCLTERLPVMICPRWVMTRTQPIAIDDVLDYLVSALDVPESKDEIVEIGGASIETYRSMMLTYARIRGLKRWLLRVPVLTPRLSSYWLNLVTPFPAAITRPLIEGLKTEVVCTSGWASTLFPGIVPMRYAAAVEAAVSADWSGQIGGRDDPAQCVARSTQEPGNHLRCSANSGACASGPGVRRVAGPGRKGWLVVRELVVADTRMARSLARRSRHVPRSRRKSKSAGRRLRGFLARRRSRARGKDFSARRNEVARSSLVAVCADSGFERAHASPLLCLVRAAWTCRRALLVGAVSHPRVDFPWHGASYCSQV